jgi:putative transposase
MSNETPTDQPKRSRPVHLPVLAGHGRTALVFLTVCTRERQPVLATPEMHQLLRNAWTSADHWLVGRYMIMPDHIHLFCAPATQPPESLVTWTAYWKRLAALSTGGSFWQKNFWDIQLRGHESYQQKWDYVRNNPVRAGLISAADAWPHQGELNVLAWHD